jgi:hypothetical protein
MFELGKFKESSSAMASFVEGVLSFGSVELIEYGEQFTLNLKDAGLEWLISPEWVDDKKSK